MLFKQLDRCTCVTDVIPILSSRAGPSFCDSMKDGNGQSQRSAICCWSSVNGTDSCRCAEFVHTGPTPTAWARFPRIYLHGLAHSNTRISKIPTELRGSQSKKESPICKENQNTWNTMNALFSLSVALASIMLVAFHSYDGAVTAASEQEHEVPMVR